MSKRTIQDRVAGWLVALCLAAAGSGCNKVTDENYPEPGGSCDDYLDEAPGASVTVRLSNARAEAVFVGSLNGCGGIAPYSIRDSAGTVHPWHLDACSFTCEDLQSHSGACAADCAIPPVYLVAPGGHFDMTWDGTVLETVLMPNPCFFEGGGSGAGECQRRVTPESGTYEFTGEAFPEATGCASGACTCTPSPEGSCQVEDAATVSGTPLSATATVAYPDEALVEIVFE